MGLLWAWGLIGLALGCGGEPLTPIGQRALEGVQLVTEPVPTVPREEPLPTQERLPLASRWALEPGRYACGGFGQLALAEEPLELLGGGLSYRGFVGTDDTPRGYNVMWAPEPLEQETRAMAAAGDGRFVILARELHQLASEEGELAFEQEARTYLRSSYRERAPQHELVRLPLSGGLRAVALIPAALAAQGDASLALALLLAQPDGRLQDIGMYVSPELTNPGCIELAQALAGSLAEGSRQPSRRARTHDLDAGALRLSIRLPQDWLVVRQPGPDFVAFHVYKLAPLGHYPGKLLIYLGAHPDSSEVEGATDLGKGKLAGRAALWRGNREQRVMQAQVPLGGMLQLKVVAQASRDAAFLDEARAVAETIAQPPTQPPTSATKATDVPSPTR